MVTAAGRRPAVASFRAVVATLLLPVCGVATCGPEDPSTGQDPVDVVDILPDSIPVTGPAAPGMDSYDEIVTALMREHRVPGGAVAVVKDGRLVFAHGYGWSDVEHGVATRADDLFRVASLSKPVTAAAVLLLVDAGMLSLGDRAFPLLSDLAPPPGADPDPRLALITIEQLLQHSGGWDREQSFDPMFRPDVAAAAVGEPAPASAETVVRYMLGQTLQFEPGSRYAYSNFGYDVLGRVIERITGAPYEPWVRDHLLIPAGAARMMLGRTRLEDAAAAEVRYYAVPGAALDARTVPSVFPGAGSVPEPYGGFYLEAMDAHGGWLASPVDYLRFVGSVDGRPGRADLLTPSSVQAMIAHPSPVNRTWNDTAYWYGLGWLVRPSNGDANWWHGGSLPGSTTLVVRAWNGLAWAAFFNTRTESRSGDAFAAALDPALWRAAERVTSWPQGDLFPLFPTAPGRPGRAR